MILINKSTTLFISVSFIIFIGYYTYQDTYYSEEYKSLQYTVQKLERMEPFTGTEDFLINTTGCYIPNYGKTLVFKEAPNDKKKCGDRAIFIQRFENEQIAFRINTTILEKYSKSKDVKCSYRFVSRSNVSGEEDTHISYTEKQPIKDGTKITLREEVIVVDCSASSNKKHASSSSTVYEDAYVIVKKLSTEKQTSDDKRWNVLLIGMDTMSRARLLSSMPKTVQYFQEHGWLDYKAYHKIGPNTFPNLIAVLTAKKLNTINEKCKYGMGKCNDLIVWSKFRKAGYITAYGEDNLRLPDTFSSRKGFQTLPTHHYMRPFFLTGETIKGNLICAKHKPSATHLLDYAHEFANIYKNDKFFGLFWINSYSHNVNNSPKLIDKEMVSFFDKLNSSDVMKNTIIIFLSDHGIRFGDLRLRNMESYYEERLPMLFVWTPLEFRKLYAEKYYNLQLNQNRLVTPYDLHVTLVELTNTPIEFDVETDACPQCSSLFEKKSANRTCADAEISDKWCSCHDMIKVNSSDTGLNASLDLAVKYIQEAASLVKTKNCSACHSLYLDKVLRSHSYQADNKTHYVVAWQMAPGAVSFEATVVREGNNYTISHPTDTISAYNTRGACTIDMNQRKFCVCKYFSCEHGLASNLLLKTL